MVFIVGAMFAGMAALGATIAIRGPDRLRLWNLVIVLGALGAAVGAAGLFYDGIRGEVGTHWLTMLASGATNTALMATGISQRRRSAPTRFAGKPTSLPAP